MATADFFGNLGTSLLGGAINSIFGSMMADHNAQINYKYNEMAAQQADKRQRALYEDYMSPLARMQQLKQAGLSPALYAEGAGGGNSGMSMGAQGSGAGGVGIPNMVNSLNLADIKLKEAQARDLNASADKKEGKNAEGAANIANLWAQAGHHEAAKALTEVQKTTAEWNNYILSNTADIDINKAFSLAEKAANDAQIAAYQVLSALAQAQVDEATINTKISQATANLEFTNAQTLLAKSNIKLNEANEKRAIAEINKWREELKQGWQHLNNDLYNCVTQRAMWKTTDEHMARSMQVLEERLSFDKDLGERKFLWTMVNDTYNAMLGAYGTITPVKPK